MLYFYFPVVFLNYFKMYKIMIIAFNSNIVLALGINVYFYTEILEFVFTVDLCTFLS